MKTTTQLFLAAVVLVGLLLLPSFSVAAPSDAKAIMEKADERDDGDNMTGDVTMTLIDQGGRERKREIKVFSKDEGRDTHRLQFFLSPADVRRTGFLSYDYYSGEKDDDQWLYLPDLKKTKRIATSDKSSSFMGSDFSYADMTRRVLDEWNYKLLKEQDVGGHPCWLIEAVPVSKTVEKRYGYKKSIVFVRQDNFVVVRAIHLLSEGGKVKYMETRKLEKIDHIWVATEIWMKTTRKKRTLHRTILNWKNVQFNQDLSRSFFSIRQLEKGL